MLEIILCATRVHSPENHALGSILVHPPILRYYKELKNRAQSGRTVPKIVRPTAGLCAPGAECTLNFEHCRGMLTQEHFEIWV